MPYKFQTQTGIDIQMQKYRVENWPEYNQALKRRGRIDTYVSPAVANCWYEDERVNDGSGSCRKYTDFASCNLVRNS